MSPRWDRALLAVSQGPCDVGPGVLGEEPESPSASKSVHYWGTPWLGQPRRGLGNTMSLTLLQPGGGVGATHSTRAGPPSQHRWTKLLLRSIPGLP